MSSLVGNYSVFHKSWGNYLAGPTTSTTLGNDRTKVLEQNRLELFGSKVTSYPIGYGGDSNIRPIRAGGLSSRYVSAGGSVTTANLVPALPMTANLSASGDVTTAILALIVNLEAALTASGTITNAQLAIIANLTASITASGTITTADLGNILNMTAALSASGNLTTANLTTLINLSADISNAAAGELTYQGIAEAVLDALLADHNGAGTVGEALNNVGAGGNPWSSDLSTNNNPGSFGERVQKLLTTAKYLGTK